MDLVLELVLMLVVLLVVVVRRTAWNKGFFNAALRDLFSTPWAPGRWRRSKKGCRAKRMTTRRVAHAWHTHQAVNPVLADSPERVPRCDAEAGPQTVVEPAVQQEERETITHRTGHACKHVRVGAKE